MRGRVMAFWATAFLGSSTIGGPIVGWAGEHIGPRWALGLGGLAAVIAAFLGWMMLAWLAAGEQAQAPIGNSSGLTAEGNRQLSQVFTVPCWQQPAGCEE